MKYLTAMWACLLVTEMNAPTRIHGPFQEANGIKKLFNPFEKYARIITDSVLEKGK